MGGFFLLVAYIEVSFRFFSLQIEMWRAGERVCECRCVPVCASVDGFECATCVHGDFFQWICLPLLTCDHVSPLGGRKIQTSGARENFGRKQPKDCRCSG